MADTLTVSRPELFPVGTTVKVFLLPATLGGEQLKNNVGDPAAWKPAPTLLSEPVVASNGTLEVPGAAPSPASYLCWASVSGKDVYLRVFGPSGSTTGAVTSGSPKKVKVKTTDTPILAANPNRTGLQIQNTGATPVYLQLGAAAVSEEGIYLPVSGGAWDGLIGPEVYTGAVRGIASAETTVTVVEV